MLEPEMSFLRSERIGSDCRRGDSITTLPNAIWQMNTRKALYCEKKDCILSKQAIELENRIGRFSGFGKGFDNFVMKCCIVFHGSK